MAKFTLDFGSTIDLLTANEVAEVLEKRDAEKRADVAGLKYRRLPILSGQASSGVLDIGGDSRAGWSGQPIGPAAGWMWMLKLLSVNGLTTGSTPDIVNLFIRGAGSNLAWWQFNGNNFAYTFGRSELVMLPNETLRLASQGTFAATGTISLIGSVIQVPAERYGEVI